MHSRCFIYIWMLLFGIAYTESLDVKKEVRLSQQACQRNQLRQYRLYRRRPIRYHVLGGVRTRPGEFSYMVALGWQSDSTPGEYNFKCGGVLIDPNIVLTAAHCVTPSKPVVILPGGVKLISFLAYFYNISEIIVHPEYKNGEIYNDIAIIKLAEPVVSKTHNPACLYEETSAASDLTVIAAGYGLTDGGQRSPELLKAPLVTMPNQQCNEIFKKFGRAPRGIISSQVCAKDPDLVRATCKGDSGGPIVYEKYENRVKVSYILGITSQGVGCTTKFPGIYTRVSDYLNWIEDNVWK